jgi:hypothetical protein
VTRDWNEQDMYALIPHLRAKLRQGPIKRLVTFVKEWLLDKKM